MVTTRVSRRKTLQIGIAVAASIGGPAAFGMISAATIDNIHGDPIYIDSPTYGSLDTKNRGSQGICSIAWSPDGKFIAAAGSDTVFVWNVKSKEVVFTIDVHPNMIQTLTWSPSGSYIACGSVDGMICVWGVAQKQPIYQKFYDIGINEIVWSPTGQHLAIAAPGVPLQIWDVFDYRTYARFANSLECSNVAWSPDGKSIVAGDSHGVIKIWDINTQKRLMVYANHINLWQILWSNVTIQSVAWSPNGKYIASGDNQGRIHVWDAANATHLFTYAGHGDHNMLIERLSWSPDSKKVASCASGNVHVWDVTNGATLAIYTDPAYAQTVAWSPTGSLLASGGYQGTVDLWSF